MFCYDPPLQRCSVAALNAHPSYRAFRNNVYLDTYKNGTKGTLRKREEAKLNVWTHMHDVRRVIGKPVHWRWSTGPAGAQPPIIKLGTPCTLGPQL